MSWLMPLAVALAIALPCGASAAGPSKAVPHRAFWGAWIGSQITGTEPPWDMNAVTTFEAEIGRGLSLVEFASPFADCGAGPCSYYEFPAQAMERVRRYGAIPFFSWGSQVTPWDSAHPDSNSSNITLTGIVNGSYDRYIRSFAQEAAAWGHPFFLRFDWEMNGNWFPWGAKIGDNRPGTFVAAWRHVYDIFQAAGATNATWVWCPFAQSRLAAGGLRAYYPGGRYVNWTCLDGYNWGKNGVNSQRWRSFDKIFASSYSVITRKIAKRKPMILGEIASSTNGGNKARWIRQMMRSLPRSFPKIRGLIWFDAFDRGIDWPLESSAAGLRAFAQGLKSAHLGYTTNEYSNLADGPILPPG